ncbi:MAG TPA: AroM family protein [Rectinema sp.]|mgnify:CR=1 FL=1|nr:AroM family protein [Rectinema sp.]
MSNGLRLGIITIGQSPRTDVLEDFTNVLGFMPKIEQKGLLDNLSNREIESLAPDSNEDNILVTRLKDGSETRLSERKAIERLPKAVKDLEESNVDIIVLFCTGEFPPLSSKVPILYPSEIVRSLVLAFFSSRINVQKRLCVVAPTSKQIPMLANKWQIPGLELFFESLSPYTSSESEVLKCAQIIDKFECDMIVLDCIGYTEKIRKLIAKVTGKPVILPRSILARILAEIVSK